MSVDRVRALLSAGLGEGATAPAASPGTLARRSRWSVPIGATIVIALVALAGAVAVSALAPKGATTTVGAEAAAANPSGVSTGEFADDGGGDGDGGSGSGSGSGGDMTPGVPIFVHILGAVSAPGLYELRDGDRAVDAVAAAGGFTEGADLAQLNLARFVSDGEQIVVPIIGAEPPSTSPGLTASGKVNINTADAVALETLPRVGPAMSARIIAWREQNGRFVVVEDLMNVSGVGEKTFDGLKELISI